jgi:pilus assembly protein CpaF
LLDLELPDGFDNCRDIELNGREWDNRRNVTADDRKRMAGEIRREVIQRLDRTRNVSDDEVMNMIEEYIFGGREAIYLDISEKREMADAVFNSLRRLDILQPIIDDKSITEIMINGPDNIFFEREGRIHKMDAGFESAEKLEDVIQAIVSGTNRAVNEASPIVDVILPDGSRVNVVLKPVALNGPIMTIRKFPDKPMTLKQLVETGTLSAEAAEDLCCLVRSKYNIFICGGTSSGKTTLLNALAGKIPGDERLVTIEDSAELQIMGIENIVRLETRNANSEGKGRITMRDLIKTSLRMRPERIIVGEVRGEEALDMLQAMNTGHDGSLSTGHANSAADMLKRLETMVLSAAPLPLEAVRQQIASAIDIIIHLAKLRDKSRRVLEICEITGCYDGQIRLNPLYLFEESENAEKRKTVPVCADTVLKNNEDNAEDTVRGSLRRTGNTLVNTEKLKMAGISCRLGGGS